MNIHELSGEQYSVLLALVKYGTQTKQRALFIVAAVETGLVEDDLHNRNTATASNPAVGWRQEEPPYGSVADRLDMSKSVPAFYRECAEHYRRGMTAGQLAAEVQRPERQYRGRYEERSGEAYKLITELGNNAGAAGGLGAYFKGSAQAAAQTANSPNPQDHSAKTRYSGQALSIHGQHLSGTAAQMRSLRTRLITPRLNTRRRNVRV